MQQVTLGVDETSDRDVCLIFTRLEARSLPMLCQPEMAQGLQLPTPLLAPGARMT